jgi:hypothetical protein
LQNYLLFITYLHWWERWILSAIPNATTAATPTPTTIAIFDTSRDRPSHRRLPERMRTRILQLARPPNFTGVTFSSGR